MIKAHYKSLLTKYGLWFKQNTYQKVNKKGAFGGTYFRDIYSGINGKWYRKSWKEFCELKDFDRKYYCSNCYDVSVNKY